MGTCRGLVGIRKDVGICIGFRDIQGLGSSDKVAR